MKEKKLAVLFPGNQYTVQAPLLYYANLVLKEKGYQVLPVSYADVSQDAVDWIVQAAGRTAAALEQLGVGEAAQLVFVGKSIGTIVAGETARLISRPVSCLFLSPLPGSLDYMKELDCQVFAGDKDRLMDRERLEQFCGQHQIPCRIFEQAGHAIVDRSNALHSADILKEIVSCYEDFF